MFHVFPRRKDNRQNHIKEYTMRSRSLLAGFVLAPPPNTTLPNPTFGIIGRFILPTFLRLNVVPGGK